MKLKQTVSKQFRHSFETVFFRFSFISSCGQLKTAVWLISPASQTKLRSNYEYEIIVFFIFRPRYSRFRVLRRRSSDQVWNGYKGPVLHPHAVCDDKRLVSILYSWYIANTASDFHHSSESSQCFFVYLIISINMYTSVCICMHAFYKCCNHPFSLCYRVWVYKLICLGMRWSLLPNWLLVLLCIG